MVFNGAANLDVLGDCEVYKLRGSATVSVVFSDFSWLLVDIGSGVWGTRTSPEPTSLPVRSIISLFVKVYTENDQ